MWPGRVREEGELKVRHLDGGPPRRVLPRDLSISAINRSVFLHFLCGQVFEPQLKIIFLHDLVPQSLAS